MIRQIEFRLRGATTPSGEIAAKDLVAIVGALQDLVTRVSRDVAGSEGSGRAVRHMEEYAQVRVSGFSAGSTLLEFHKGPTGKLDLELSEHVVADARLWEILSDIATNHRRQGLDERLVESAGRLAKAMQDAAQQVLIRSESAPQILIDSHSLRIETWSAKPELTGETAAMAGWLEKVDLHSHELRVRDDAGNAVELRHVVGDSVAARLIGTWVTCRGYAIEAADGRLLALDNARVEKITDPAAAFVGDGMRGVDELLAGAPGPDPDGGIDLTDEEFQSFLRAARS